MGVEYLIKKVGVFYMYNGIEKREYIRIAKPITASFRIRSDEARKTETND